jgi:hypothetical protein
MPKLYGRSFIRRDLAAHSGALSQFAGVRLLTLGDGVERDVRMLEFRTGSGLRFTVLIDRAFDIAECEHNGRAIGWHSPAGFRHPGLHEYEGEGGLGWLRSFSGLLVTCGLDHILAMHEEPADHYLYRFRKSVKNSIHGRISTIPGKLVGYGEIWNGDECALWCEGLVQQSTVFGEDLHLARRIEARVGSNEIVLKDRVINHGFYRTPHMLLYHINIGYPALSDGSSYLAPIADTVWAAHAGDDYHKQGVGYHRLCGPRQSFREQVWQHEMEADAQGCVPTAIVNDAMGFGILVETNKAEFPAQFEWQNFQAGQYTIGIEPATNHILGKPFAQERSELIWLEHGEERNYTTRLIALDGASDITSARQRIRAIWAQPDEEYPPLSGQFPTIKGRSQV